MRKGRSQVQVDAVESASVAGSKNRVACGLIVQYQRFMRSVLS